MQIGCNDSDDDMSPRVLSGRFLDSPVQGINYVSGRESGITDQSGIFLYESENTVTFSIGNVLLGTAMGSSLITPVDIVENSTGASDANVINIVRFLIMLDSDGDPSNGIHIEDEIASRAINWSVDFSSNTFDDDIRPIVDEVDSIYTHTVELIGLAAAQAHLEGTIWRELSGDYSGTYEGESSNNTGGIWYFSVLSDGNINGIIGRVDGQFCAVHGTLGTDPARSFELGTIILFGVRLDFCGITTFQGSILDGQIASGEWRDLADMPSGSFSGEKVEEEFQGSYTGTYSGTDMGSFVFNIDGERIIKGFTQSSITDVFSALSGTVDASGNINGIFNSNNEVTANFSASITKEIISPPVPTLRELEQRSLDGAWVTESNDGGVLTGADCRLKHVDFGGVIITQHQCGLEPNYDVSPQ